jgi:ring-1,2-phenylacetyl-CoA epoxidase subunit PaaC
MESNNALYKYCLQLGDDALILGHRLSELCSKGPFLEEDLALTNISLDMIGRAQAFLNYASKIENKGNSDDDLAYRRPEKEYNNHLLVEQPNGNFADTIARQFLISAFEVSFFKELSNSKDEMLSGIAAKTVKEAKYHFQHSAYWIIRLGDGTEVSKVRIQKAINDLWMYTGELFEMSEVDEQLLQKGIAVDRIPLKQKWSDKITEVLSQAKLGIPEDEFMQSGGKKGIHTENLGHILSEMQYLQRAYPDAKW